MLLVSRLRTVVGNEYTKVFGPVTTLRVQFS